MMSLSVAADNRGSFLGVLSSLVIRYLASDPTEG
jgi:hypothetical protein